MNGFHHIALRSARALCEAVLHTVPPASHPFVRRAAEALESAILMMDPQEDSDTAEAP